MGKSPRLSVWCDAEVLDHYLRLAGCEDGLAAVIIGKQVLDGTHVGCHGAAANTHHLGELRFTKRFHNERKWEVRGRV